MLDPIIETKLCDDLSSQIWGKIIKPALVKKKSVKEEGREIIFGRPGPTQTTNSLNTCKR